MRFGILGAVLVRGADGREIAIGGPRTRTLLTLLLAEAGHIVPTERLIDGSYGSEVPDGAANALQSQVSRLRKQLGAGLVEFHPTGYRLAVDPAEVDAPEFEHLADQGRRALLDGDPATANRLLGEALALWRGPALADAPAAQAIAARLEERRLDAIEDRAQARLALPGRRDLVPELRELVAAHPLRERLRGQLMRALAASGRQAEALTEFENTRRTLAEELGADPSDELTETHLAVLRGSVDDLRVTAPPAQLTSFVGRAGDLDRLTALLGQHRLVTLTGPGGAGKTRLAVEAVRELDGPVCFVALANALPNVTDGAEAGMAVLAAVGLRDTGRSVPTVDRLIAALRDRPMLLVLDNCEHVIEPTATLAARLLAECPELRMLATSREPLGITGETLYAVPRLGLPERDVDPVTALEHSAIRLFVERARAGRADFAPHDDNLADVLRICRELDGLPLAIELAAARVRALPVDELAARLRDRFALLANGSRTAEARHRTLRAVVEWSWELVSEPERELARRLTVFTGGATLAAVEGVCRSADPVTHLTGLVDKSLVENVGDRYQMLETIRVFAAERLAEAQEADQYQRAGAEYFLAFAETALPHLLRADQTEWLARLDEEFDNLHGALRWAIDNDTTLALRLVRALTTYWWLRGRRSDGARLCLALVKKLGTTPPDGLAEEFALCVLGAVFGLADRSPLRAQLDYVEDLDWEDQRRFRLPFFMAVRSATFGPPREWPLDEQYEGIRTFEPAGSHPWVSALMALGQGFHQLHHGDPDGAGRSLRAALAGYRALGERWGMTQTMCELAQLLDWRGERDAALAMMDETIDLLAQIGAVEEMTDMLARRAVIRARARDDAGARADYERSAELAARTGDTALRDGALAGIADLDRLAGDLAAARVGCERAMDQSAGGSYLTDAVRVRACITLGRMASSEDEAVSWLRTALGVAADWGNRLFAADAVEALAGVTLRAGDAAVAARLLGTGFALRGTEIAGDRDVAAVRSGARDILGAEEFGAEYANGVTMPLPGIHTVEGM